MLDKLMKAMKCYLKRLESTAQHSPTPRGWIWKRRLFRQDRLRQKSPEMWHLVCDHRTSQKKIWKNGKCTLSYLVPKGVQHLGVAALTTHRVLPPSWLPKPFPTHHGTSHCVHGNNCVICHHANGSFHVFLITVWVEMHKWVLTMRRETQLCSQHYKQSDKI